MSAAPKLLEEQKFGSMRLRANLPPGWRVVNYVANHHYIELEDDQGNTYKVMATDLIKGTCTSCKNSIYVESRIGAMACPHCQSGTVNWVWGEAKISFVPEPHSRFISSLPPAPKAPIGDEDTVP